MNTSITLLPYSDYLKWNLAQKNEVRKDHIFRLLRHTETGALYASWTHYRADFNIDLQYEVVTQASDEQYEAITHIMAGHNVQINAVAGSGKTSTILMAAELMKRENTPRRITLITFNKALQVETDKKIKLRVKASQLTAGQVTVFTFHGHAKQTFKNNRNGLFNDKCVAELITNNAPLVNDDPNAVPDILAIDEVQDMYTDIYRYVCFYLNSIPRDRRPSLVLLGDPDQCIYADLKNANPGYLLDYATYWAPLLKSAAFKSLNLSITFRMTRQITGFVNEYLCGGGKMISYRDGPKVRYVHWAPNNNLINGTLMERGHNIFVKYDNIRDIMMEHFLMSDGSLRSIDEAEEANLYRAVRPLIAQNQYLYVPFDILIKKMRGYKDDDFCLLAGYVSLKEGQRYAPHIIYVENYISEINQYLQIQDKINFMKLDGKSANKNSRSLSNKVLLTTGFQMKGSERKVVYVLDFEYFAFQHVRDKMPEHYRYGFSPLAYVVSTRAIDEMIIMNRAESINESKYGRKMVENNQWGDGARLPAPRGPNSHYWKYTLNYPVTLMRRPLTNMAECSYVGQEFLINDGIALIMKGQCEFKLGIADKDARPPMERLADFKEYFGHYCLPGDETTVRTVMPGEYDTFPFHEMFFIDQLFLPTVPHKLDGLIEYSLLPSASYHIKLLLGQIMQQTVDADIVPVHLINECRTSRGIYESVADINGLTATSLAEAIVNRKHDPMFAIPRSYVIDNILRPEPKAFIKFCNLCFNGGNGEIGELVMAMREMCGDVKYDDFSFIEQWANIETDKVAISAYRWLYEIMMDVDGVLKRAKEENNITPAFGPLESALKKLRDHFNGAFRKPESGMNKLIKEKIITTPLQHLVRNVLRPLIYKIVNYTFEYGTETEDAEHNRVALIELAKLSFRAASIDKIFETNYYHVHAQRAEIYNRNVPGILQCATNIVEVTKPFMNKDKNHNRFEREMQIGWGKLISDVLKPQVLKEMADIFNVEVEEIMAVLYAAQEAHCNKKMSYRPDLIIDYGSYCNLWEFKTTNELEMVHKLQLVTYYCVHRIFCPDHSVDGAYLFNSRSNETFAIDVERADELARRIVNIMVCNYFLSMHGLCPLSVSDELYVDEFVVDEIDVPDDGEDISEIVFDL